MCLEALVDRRTVPYLLALFHLSVTEWPYTPPCCIQRRMAPLFFYSSLPPLLNPWETR